MTYKDISKTSKEFMFDNPFFGHILMRLKKTITDKIDTAAVTIDPKSFNVELLINSKFWETLTPGQRVGILHHEVMHVAFGHLETLSTYNDKKIANLAMDMEINQYVLEENRFPDGIFFDKAPFDHLKLAPNKGSKFYYQAIEEEAKNNPAFKKMLKGLPGGSNHGQWKNYEDLTSQEKKIFDNQQKHVKKEAYKESDQKNMGSLPGGLSREIEKLFEKKPQVFNWKSWFRKFLGTVLDIARKKTYKRESKRFKGLPGLRTKRKISLFVSVDTSGSMGNKEIADVFEQINYIWKAGAVIRVVTWDTKIHDDFIYDGKPPKNIHGGGGSCIDPVIELYNAKKRDYTAAIHLTDGHISCNKKLLGLHLFVITAKGTMFDPGSKCRMFQIPEDTGEKS